jgi:hypothetical protein
MKRLLLPLAIALVAARVNADATGRGAIDETVLRRLNKLDIQPAQPCSDAVFVRRVHLDVIGTLPAPEEARQFLLDKRPDKRRALIDRLLEREEFADFWAMKWCDLLRVKAEFPINLWPNAVQAYHRWIRTSIKRNMPYDRFVRELLTESGSNFRVPQVNFYRGMQSREPEDIARTVALTFMGVRADKWPEERLQGMTAFFTHVGYKGTQEWKEQVVFFDSVRAARIAATGTLGRAVCPDGTAVKLSPDRDPREEFADWLIQPDNPWFTRNIVNRVWSWLLGRGIIHEPDDIRPDNPPKQPELLLLLQKELVASNYDLKHLYRLILSSETYQRASVPVTDTAQSAAHFAHYPIRRLEAEVLIDALNQITGTTEQYSSYIPEPFTFIPEDLRTITLADGSITSPFLEMFGRPPRDTGQESERNNTPTAAQRLHLLNSSHVHRKLVESEKLQKLISSAGKSRRRIMIELYLTILSRLPTEKELAVVKAYAQGEETKGNKALVDLAWALINSTEFLYRH